MRQKKNILKYLIKNRVIIIVVIIAILLKLLYLILTSFNIPLHRAMVASVFIKQAVVMSSIGQMDNSCSVSCVLQVFYFHWEKSSGNRFLLPFFFLPFLDLSWSLF